MFADWQSVAAGGHVAVGTAYSSASVHLVDAISDLLDYIEYPFELLRKNEQAVSHARKNAAILHCASLSLASGDVPTQSLLQSVVGIASDIQSPWLGEHLAFISARPLDGDPGERFDIGYALSPPMNADTVDIVSNAIITTRSSLNYPLILENSPIYVQLPGSNLSQAEVMTEICRRTDANLLLDLAHLQITCHTLALDPRSTLLEFPIDRVVEVHMSGVSSSAGELWDDHSGTPDDMQYDLLRLVLERAPVQAVTHEYNWAPTFPPDLARREILRTIDLIARTV